MKNGVVITFIILAVLVDRAFNQEKFSSEAVMTSPAGLPGMRCVPSNIPDISVIGDFYYSVSNEKHNADSHGLIIRSVELALQGYIYPEIRADIFLAMHKHGDHIDAELCEAKVSFLKLFDGLSAEIGRIHVSFGKVNKIHQHHRPYVDQPEVVRKFLGEHGLVGDGLCLSYSLPLPFFSQLDIGVWQVPTSSHHEETEVHTHASENLTGEVYTGRLWLSFPIRVKSELEIGVSALHKGNHHHLHEDEIKIVGGDLTYKLWPSAHTRFIVQNEFFYLVRNNSDEEIKKWGFYTFAGYKFNKYWSVGVRYDNVEDTSSYKEDHAEPTRAVSTILTRYLTETTFLRCQYKYHFEEKKDVHEGYLQLVFGIGPHSHPLE